MWFYLFCKICIETDENENTTTQNLWDTVKAVLRGKFIAIQAHLKNRDRHSGGEVRGALGSTAVNKAVRCDGIPIKLFKTLKDDAIKVLYSICQQIWKIQQWPHDWKRSILIPIPKKGSTKEYANH